LKYGTEKLGDVTPPLFFWGGGIFVIKVLAFSGNWSERSACAARAALQTGCMANEVAIKFIFSLSFYLPLSLLFWSE
jgi:hypothetical protein